MKSAELEDWLDRGTFMFFLCCSLMNFLPVFLGYSSVESASNEYHYPLSSNEYQGSLIASLAASLAPFIEHILDWVVFVHKYLTTITSSSFLSSTPSSNGAINPPRKKGHHYCIPFREIILLLILPDVILLFWVIPQEQYDYVAAIIGARDTMYISSFLAYMVRLKNPIWTWRSSFIISFSFMICNILCTIKSQIVTLSDSYLAFSAVMLPLSLTVGFFFLLVNATRWVIYIRRVDTEDKSGELKHSLLNVYTAFYVIFVVGDWSQYYTTSVPADWNRTGVSSLTMYAYLMAGCTLCVTVLTSRLLRLEASETKVLIGVRITYRISNSLLVIDLSSNSYSCATYRTKSALL